MTLLIILNIILFVLLIISVLFNIKFGGMLLKFEDNIEEALSVMDRSYMNISNILQTPITFDDPYIRQVLNEIKNVREAILTIAIKVSLSEKAKQDFNNDNDTQQ